MNQNAENIIAFLFKRSGKKTMYFSEIYLTLSMDLNWFTPEDAKTFVNTAIEQKMLIKKDDMIRPGFDIQNIKIPVGFQPSKTIFKKEETQKQTTGEKQELIDLIANEIVKQTKNKKEKIIDEIQKISEGKNLKPEIAALLVGKEHDVSLEKFYKKIEEECFQ
jgi:hypothetical protein